MADVFISYKRENRAAAESFSTHLARAGFSVWWDDEISPREPWDATIEREITAASSVVVLWTPQAVGSEWVRTEAHNAHAARKLVPVKIEPCEPPFAFTLTQTIDLVGWSGDPENRHWRKLLTWLADLRAPKSTAGGTTFVNPFRNVVDQFANGEPVFDGVFINAATPAGTLFRDETSAPVMRVLPRGRVLIGGAPGDPDRINTELPQKNVTFDNPLAMSVFPVTGSEFDRFGPSIAVPAAAPVKRGWFGAKAAPAPPARTRAAPDCPANFVSLRDAERYCIALSAETGSAYRLPSEAEWEYACRGNTAERYYWGDVFDPAYACSGGGGPVPPGRFPPNPFGLYDMHGNVREWTQDLWHEHYNLLPTDGSAVTDGHSSMRVTRGGGWSDPPSQFRASARGRATETLRSELIGFRVVCDLAKGRR